MVSQIYFQRTMGKNTKNKKLRLAAAKKTVAKLEGDHPKSTLPESNL
jgi:hypothetical protein